MVSHKDCPLCSSSRIEFYLKCRDHLLSGEEFDLFRCKSCRFIFTHEYPEVKDIGRYYESDDYISHDDNAAGITSRIYYIVRKMMLRKKRKIIKEATGLNKGRLLDIGCGTGHFPGFMKSNGWSVTGIEPNRKAREFCEQKYGFDVIDPDDIAKLPGGSFDCITMWHVLEHFHDPSAYVIDILRLLKPEGICIVALPNSNSFDALYFEENWAAWDVPRHLWHFDPSTFRVFCEKEGFSIIKVKALPFDVFYISILSEKNKGKRFSFIAGLLKGIRFSIKSIFRKKRGSSLIYFLTKNGA